jgi:ABC-type multidrug transport system ATPase subunit
MVIEKISGSIEFGHVTGIIGPSGSGKTTFLTRLRDLAKFKTTSAAFVPKEDLIDRELTAREIFTLAAKLNLASSGKVVDNEETYITEAVERTLGILKLGGVADVIVGGGPNSAANISGGQLKRVSIGMELISAPNILFLDEPTSGLDATASLELLQNLHSIAATSGAMIIAVLHQPRVESWDLLDKVFVLGLGGRLVYSGPPNDLPTYMEKSGLGYSFEQDSKEFNIRNPADWALDVVSGGILPKSLKPAQDVSSYQRQGLVTNASKLLAEAWEKHELQNASANANLFVPSETAPSSKFSMRGFFVQCYLQTKRTLLVRLRSTSQLMLYCFLHIFLAAALSSGFSPIIQTGGYTATYSPVISTSLQPYCPSFLSSYCNIDVQLDGLKQMMFFTTVACGAASAIAGVQAFADQQDIIRRERFAGASVLAFGIGRFLGDVIIVAWNGIVFTGVWTLLGAAGVYYNWLAIYISISFVASGVGYCISLVTTTANASMLVTIIMLAFAVFNGIDPPISAINRLPVVNWVWYLSFASYVSNAVYITFTSFIAATRDIKAAAASEFGFSVDDFNRCIGAMFGLGFLWRFVALFILELKFTTFSNLIRCKR